MSVMAGGRAGGKSATAFRTISEVSEELEVPQHVLRFWETKFSAVRPLKRGGGRRYYRPEDVDLLRRIRSLLYDEGYTIKGVQRLLKESHGKAPQKAAKVADRGGRVDLDGLLGELIELRDMLRGARPAAASGRQRLGKARS